MLIGRAIFGVACENLITSQTSMVSLWFRGKELSTAIGVIMTVPEVGSALNSLLSPLLFNWSDTITLPLFFSVILCFISFLAAVALVLLDRKAELTDKKNESLFVTFRDHDQSGEEEEEAEAVKFSDIKNFKSTFWILTLICSLVLAVYTPFLDNANVYVQRRYGFSNDSAGVLIMIPYLLSGEWEV